MSAPRPTPSRAIAFAQSLAAGIVMGLACGAGSAAFLLVLDRATRFREAHERIVYALPLAGLVIGAAYQRWGHSVRRGSDLVVDAMRNHDLRIPKRMAPMVLAGTIATHFFGGSAGREGTAVQMGASMADAIATRVGISGAARKPWIVAGVAGGFGSVFGTPLAGALFGIEVGGLRRAEYIALAPALIAALLGDWVTRHLGVTHTSYPALAPFALGPLSVGKLCVIGVVMGLTATTFVEATHRAKHWLEARVSHLGLRMFLGGAIIVALWKLVGTSDYLGLSIPLLVRAFSDPTLWAWAFAAKLVFTSVTLGTGFLGGEVTPLFVIGATLGSVMARLMGLPIALGAGAGIAAVFGAAANTPLALSLMAVELLGVSALVPVTLVTVVAFFASGKSALYPSQRRA